MCIVLSSQTSTFYLEIHLGVWANPNVKQIQKIVVFPSLFPSSESYRHGNKEDQKQKKLNKTYRLTSCRDLRTPIAKCIICNETFVHCINDDWCVKSATTSTWTEFIQFSYWFQILADNFISNLYNFLNIKQKNYCLKEQGNESEKFSESILPLRSVFTGERRI